MSEEKVVNQEGLVEESQLNYEQKAIELAKKYGCEKVHVYVGKDENGNDVVGYIKEPSYLQKLMSMDKFIQNGAMLAGEELRQTLTIQEESDPRTFSTHSCNDRYRLGMASVAVATVEIAANEFKKK